MNATPNTPPVVQALLRDARQRLQSHYGDRLRRVVLFGSQARGTAREDSDVDMLVLLDGPLAVLTEIKALSSIAYDLEVEHGPTVQFVVSTEEQYHNRRHLLMQNVQRDGIPVA